MTVIIRTEARTLANGKHRVTASGKGKQVTEDFDPRRPDESHASAAGVLGNKILDAEQQAKIHHPTGRQRFHMETPEVGKRVITLNV